MVRPTGISINPQLRFWGEWTRNRAGELAPVIRRNGDEIEMVELVWGLKPRDLAVDRAIINVRSEAREFPSHRCLVPAGEFFFHDRSGRGRWRFTMAAGNGFYFAGIWRRQRTAGPNPMQSSPRPPIPMSSPATIGRWR